MERMLRKRKDNSDYEIDRELTGMFAIEKNAEYQNRIAELEEENKKLKKECEENDYLVEDNARWMKKCEEKIMEIKNLKEEIKEIEKNQEYRYHRCMKAERQVQHSLGGDDELIYEEGLYD